MLFPCSANLHKFNSTCEMCLRTWDTRPKIHHWFTLTLCKKYASLEYAYVFVCMPSDTVCESVKKRKWLWPINKVSNFTSWIKFALISRFGSHAYIINIVCPRHKSALQVYTNLIRLVRCVSGHRSWFIPGQRLQDWPITHNHLP